MITFNTPPTGNPTIDVHKDGRSLFTGMVSSAEMVRQGYKDARRKRFKVGGTVLHVWKAGDTVTASYLNQHAADALGQHIMEMSR